MSDSLIEKVCPHCDHHNEPHVVQCVHCGQRLDDATTLAINQQTSEALARDIESSIKALVEQQLDTNNIALLIGGNNPIIESGRRRLILGRSNLDDTQRADDLIDLTWYFAHALGVSRQHALIDFIDDGYYLQDLGSTNGTRLNGERLRPLKFYPLKSGDNIQIAKLTLHVYFKLD